MKRKLYKSSSDIGSIPAIQHNDQAGAQKQISAGPVRIILGSMAAALHIKAGSTVYCYNNSGTTAFVATFAKDATPVAPTGITNGIAIPPNSYIEVGMGTNTKIIASAATVGGYLLLDDTIITEDKAPLS